MAKRKRPSRPPRRRAATAPASAPEPRADDDDTSVKGAPDAGKAVEAVGDVSRATEGDAENMQDSGKVACAGRNEPIAAEDGEESRDDGQAVISPEGGLRLSPDEGNDIARRASPSVSRPEDETSKSERAFDDQTPSEGPSRNTGEHPGGQGCPEAIEEGDTSQPPAPLDAATHNKDPADLEGPGGNKQESRLNSTGRESEKNSNVTEKETQGGSNTVKKEPESISNTAEKGLPRSSKAAEKESKNALKKPTKTSPPSEDAWTQTDDLPGALLEGGHPPPTRTQDQSVTSSDQSGGKEYTASVLARMQAGGQRMDPASLASLQTEARRTLLNVQGPDAAPVARPKRPASEEGDGRLSPPEAKRRVYGDLSEISLMNPNWRPDDPTQTFLRMRESFEINNQLDEEARQRRERRSPTRDFLAHIPDVSATRRYEIESLAGGRTSGVRYPNGLVVPQPPPPPPRRSSPNRADRASVSPPAKQSSSPRVRTAENYVTLDDDEDPMADAIRLMKAKGEFPCRLCNQVFRNLRGMKGHVREHFEKKPPYHCNVCVLFYPDKAALGRHMKIHTGERPYECRRCNFAFTTKANCERHMKNRHKLTREELAENMNVLPSDTRSKPRSPPPPTSQPVLTVSGDLTACTVCDASFGEYTPAVQHVKKFHPTKEPAQVLSVRGAVRSAAPSPVEAAQRPLPLSLPPLLPLPVGLPEGPLSTQSRSSTPRSAPRPASPPAPADVDSAPLDLSQRSERPEPAPEVSQMPSAEEALRSAALMQMPYCMPFPMPFFMPSMQMVNRQMEEMLAQTRSAGLGSGGGILTPAQMQAALQSAFSVGALGQVPPAPASEEDREPEEDGALNLTPTGTSSAPATPGALDDPRKKQKQRRYRTVRPFQCVHCDARFTLSTNMDRHVKNTHPDKWEPKSRSARRSATIVSPLASPAEPPSASEPGSSGAASATVVCVDSDDEGGLVIDEPSRDETDLASVDRLVVSAQAQTCQQYFRGDEERSTDAGSERDASASPIGDEDSERAEKRRSAYSNAPNKIPCRYCDRVFPWSSSLKRHELTHSGEKPYSCPHCPVHFTTKSNCDRHLVRKHSGGSGGDDSSTAPRPVERPFKCALCPSSTFSTQENLTRHHAQKHAPGAAGPSTHQFWCHVCDQRFFDLERTRDHLEAEHEQSWARLERSNSRWVSQIAEEDQGQDQIFCLVCLHGFADTSELRQHMTSEHLSSEDSSEEAPGAEGERVAELPAQGGCSPPPAARAAAGPPRKRPTLEDISARLLAGSRLRAATSPSAEEGSDIQEKQEVPVASSGERQGEP